MEYKASNEEFDFDEATHKRLGSYVYALRDPRDRKIFYVGKAGGTRGQGNQRVLEHFEEARSTFRTGAAPLTPKVRRILEIWAADEKVDWFIVRHGLPDDKAAFHVEAALIDALAISQNGPALNLQRGSGVAEHGLLHAADVFALATPPLSQIPPELMNRPIFIFPVHIALADGRTPYEATRGNWKVGPDYRRIENALAVGVSGGLSRGVFEIDRWEQRGALWAFIGKSVEVAGLHARNYLAIQSQAMGYLQRGGFLIVEFCGDSGFRFVRGNADKSTVFSL